MDFKKETDVVCSKLALERDDIYKGCGDIITGIIPMKNKLKDMTEAEISELYPDKVDGTLAVQKFFVDNPNYISKTEELKALLEE